MRNEKAVSKIVPTENGWVVYESDSDFPGNAGKMFSFENVTSLVKHVADTYTSDTDKSPWQLQYEHVNGPKDNDGLEVNAAANRLDASRRHPNVKMLTYFNGKPIHQDCTPADPCDYCREVLGVEE